MSHFFTSSFGKVSILSVGGVFGAYQLYTRLQDKPAQESPSIIKNQNENTRMQLKNVHIFFRHGARTPLLHVKGLAEVVYDKNILLAPVEHMEIPFKVEYIEGGPRPFAKTDSYYEKINFQGGVTAGMLTHIGKNQCYLLGSRLSKKYQALVGTKFNPSNIELRSTNINRCVQSMQCVLAGMFGYTSAMDSAVVKVENIEKECLCPNPRYCLNLQTLVDHSIAMLSKEKNYVQLFHKIQKHLGSDSVSSSWDIIELRDNIVARETHNLPVPQFLLNLFPEIDKLAVETISDSLCGKHSNYQQFGMMLATGRLLNLISSNLTNISQIKTSDVAKNKKYNSINLYACHDSTLIPLLVAFGCYDNKWPPYAADLCIELYEDEKNQHWVKVSYCDKDMVLKGCTNTLVSLDMFCNLIKPLLISEEEYRSNCDQPNLVPYQPSKKSQNRMPPNINLDER